ncbi:MAG: hypothetical protein EXR68_07565 [Dehalococcoidia bacterium]|nr:hypothetical protein [Dehalococcoidia bacterium]
MAAARLVTVVVDATASVPGSLLEDRPLLLAPVGPPRLYSYESVSSLSLDALPAEPAAAVDACRAAAINGDVLFVTVDDGHGGAPDAPELARAAVEAEGRRFAHLATNATLLQAGWPAVLAAEAAARGADLNAVLAAGQAAVGSVGMFGVIDHPELANPTSTNNLAAPVRGVARWDGPRLVAVPRPQRDIALGMLRDLFTSNVTREATAGRGRLRVAIVHAASSPAAEALAIWAARRLQASEVAVDAVTRHAASHLGPGFVAVSWVWDPEPSET